MRRKRKFWLFLFFLLLLPLFFFSLKCFLNSLRLNAEANKRDYSFNIEEIKKEKWVREDEGEFVLYKPSLEWKDEKAKEKLLTAVNFIEEKLEKDLPSFEVFCLDSNLKKKYGFPEEESFFLFSGGFAVDCEGSNSGENFLRAFFEYFLNRELGKAPLWLREGLLGFLQNEGKVPYWGLEKVLNLSRSEWKKLSSQKKEEFLKTSTYILKMVDEERGNGLSVFFDSLKAGMSSGEALEYAAGKDLEVLKRSWGLGEKSNKEKGESGKRLTIYTYILMTVASLISVVVLYRVRFS